MRAYGEYCTALGTIPSNRYNSNASVNDGDNKQQNQHIQHRQQQQIVEAPTCSMPIRVFTVSHLCPNRKITRTTYGPPIALHDASIVNCLSAVCRTNCRPAPLRLRIFRESHVPWTPVSHVFTTFWGTVKDTKRLRGNRAFHLARSATRDGICERLLLTN